MKLLLFTFLAKGQLVYNMNAFVLNKDLTVSICVPRRIGECSYEDKVLPQGTVIRVPESIARQAEDTTGGDITDWQLWVDNSTMIEYRSKKEGYAHKGEGPFVQVEIDGEEIWVSIGTLLVGAYNTIDTDKFRQLKFKKGRPKGPITFTFVGGSCQQDKGKIVINTDHLYIDPKTKIVLVDFPSPKGKGSVLEKTIQAHYGNCTVVLSVSELEKHGAILNSQQEVIISFWDPKQCSDNPQLSLGDFPELGMMMWLKEVLYFESLKRQY